MKSMGHVLTFLKHKKPEKLTELMLQNNVQKKAYHGYTIVFSEGFWYAWYEVDINDLMSETIKNESNKRKG